MVATFLLREPIQILHLSSRGILVYLLCSYPHFIRLERPIHKYDPQAIPARICNYGAYVLLVMTTSMR